MTNSVPSPDAPRPDSELLHRRLESLRQSLGADRLGVARRLRPAVAAGEFGPFEVLAVAESTGTDEPAPEASSRIPLEAVVEMLRSAGGIDRRVGSSPPVWERHLERWGADRVMGWALPTDRLPSVFFVALFERVREPGEVRLRVATSGLEALARALAPPAWMPLASAAPREAPEEHPEEWGGPDPRHVRLRSQWSRLREARLPVLIEAEAGCGARRLVEEILRAGGERGQEQWIECGGAQNDRVVAEIAEAQRPTVLHEPQLLEPKQQLRLLAHLDSRQPRPHLLLSVSRASLWSSVQDRLLHPDLYWRLAALRLELAPLRERSEEVVELFRRHWQKCREGTGRGEGKLRLDSRAQQLLTKCEWPGNLAQLRREARRVVELFPAATRLEPSMMSEELRLRATKESPESEETTQIPPLEVAVAEMERDLIRRALRLAEGNKADAARRLRLSRQGLYRKLRRHGMLEEA